MYAVLGAQYPIVIWDGKNALAERRKIYPEYKRNRTKKPKDPITYESMDVARKICENLECIQLRVEGFEADDVVAAMVDRLGADNVTFIHSNDIDLAGFGIPTLTTKDIPQPLKLYKTLVGKSSDNVKGLRLFGPKAWDKLNEEDKLIITNMLCLDPKTWPIQYTEPDEEHYSIDRKLHDKIVADLNNLKILWKISNFLHVPPSLIDAGTVKGTENLQEIEMIRSQYLLWSV